MSEVSPSDINDIIARAYSPATYARLIHHMLLLKSAYWLTIAGMTEEEAKAWVDEEMAKYDASIQPCGHRGYPSIYNKPDGTGQCTDCANNQRSLQ